LVSFIGDLFYYFRSRQVKCAANAADGIKPDHNPLFHLRKCLMGDAGLDAKFSLAHTGFDNALD